MEKIFLITGNQGKAAEYKEMIGERIAIKDLDLIEIQELDCIKIIEHKAKEAYKDLHVPVLVEDVSLEFSAIAPLPGTFVKWFLKSIGIEGLIRILADYPDKSAKAICTIGYYDGENLHTFQGIVPGFITQQPIGDNGFGFDVIFQPEGYDKTFAQMSNQEKNEISHRGRAIKKLVAFLDSK